MQENGGQVTLAPLLPKTQVQTCTPPMSADPITPLFVLSDDDDVEYKDDPAVTQAKVNLAVAERIQQERAEQKRLEREERKARAEAERLMQEIEEAERQRRELEEAEIERLTQEKEKLEEEKQAEQRRAATLRGSERAAERRWAALAASPPEAGPSRAPPQKSERTAKGVDQGLGIVIPEKNCVHCVTREVLCRWDLEGCAQSCKLCRQLKKPCWRFEELSEKGKQRAEDEGEGVAPSKRPWVGLMSEQTEWRQTEVEDPQVGSHVIEALWALNAHLGEIQAKMVAGQEATSESVRLLRCSMTYNLRWIEMMLVVQRDRSQEEGELEVKGLGEAEELGEWPEEWTE